MIVDGGQPPDPWDFSGIRRNSGYVNLREEVGKH